MEPHPSWPLSSQLQKLPWHQTIKINWRVLSMFQKRKLRPLLQIALSFKTTPSFLCYLPHYLLLALFFKKSQRFSGRN